MNLITNFTIHFFDGHHDSLKRKREFLYRLSLSLSLSFSLSFFPASDLHAIHTILLPTIKKKKRITPYTTEFTTLYLLYFGIPVNSEKSRYSFIWKNASFSVFSPEYVPVQNAGMHGTNKHGIKTFYQWHC